MWDSSFDASRRYGQLAAGEGMYMVPAGRILYTILWHTFTIELQAQQSTDKRPVGCLLVNLVSAFVHGPTNAYAHS